LPIQTIDAKKDPEKGIESDTLIFNNSIEYLL